MRPASLKAMAGRRNSGMRYGAHPVNSQRLSPKQAPAPVHAELIGSSTATALGITGRGNTPILDLCRRLIAAGHDPDQPLEAFRGDVLCLIVRTIAEGAALEINGDGTGFRPRRQPGAAPPMRQNGGGHG